MKNNPLLQRILTGTAIILGVALSLIIRELLGAEFYDAFLLTLLFFAVFEVMRATKVKDRGVKYHYVFGYLICAYLVFWFGTAFSEFNYLQHLIAQLIVLFVFVIYTYFMYYVDTDLIKQCRLHKQNVAEECRSIVIEYLKIIGYPALFVFSLILINHMGPAAPEDINLGLMGLLLVFVISAATDTLAYAVGTVLKGPKLCPKISPKKTWSGAVGGLFGGVLGSLILLLIVSRSPEVGEWLFEKGIDSRWALVVFGLIGLLGSVAVQGGDIFASYIKRKHDIKDFGKIVPGHGGVMGRQDGNIDCTAFIYVTLCIISYIL